jgi:hypothetical protein
MLKQLKESSAYIIHEMDSVGARKEQIGLVICMHVKDRKISLRNKRA